METSLLDTPSQQQSFSSDDSDGDGGKEKEDPAMPSRPRSPPAHALGTRANKKHAATTAAASRSRASLSRSPEPGNSPEPSSAAAAGRGKGKKAARPSSAVAKARARLQAIQNENAGDDSDDSDVEVTGSGGSAAAEAVAAAPVFPVNKSLPSSFKCKVYNPVHGKYTNMKVMPSTSLSKIYAAVAKAWPDEIDVDDLNLTLDERILDRTVTVETCGLKDAEDAKRIEARKQLVEVDEVDGDGDGAGDGGSHFAGIGSAAAGSTAAGEGPKYLLVLRHSAHDDQKFSISAATTFDKIFTAYAGRVQAAEGASAFKFVFDGEALDGDGVPDDADMDPKDGGDEVNLVDVYDR